MALGASSFTLLLLADSLSRLQGRESSYPAPPQLGGRKGEGCEGGPESCLYHQGLEEEWEGGTVGSAGSVVDWVGGLSQGGGRKGRLVGGLAAWLRVSSVLGSLCPVAEAAGCQGQ